MTGAQLAQLSGFLAPFVALAGVIVAKRWDRGSQREMYPAQVIANLEARVEKAEKRQDETEKRERILQDYVHQLRDHISKGQPPPPPPWPEGLHT